MTAKVTHIFRHPIKALGREALTNVHLTKGATMPFDRVWAVAHEASKADDLAWSVCGNFIRAAKAPKLMAITARLNDATDLVTLNHPELAEITLNPVNDSDALVAWVAPLVPDDRAAPTRVVSVPGRGLTDSDFPSVTICNAASHKAVEAQVGSDLSIHRWRGNFWIDGVDAWEEFSWVGREITLGGARLRVVDRTTRCMATTANPETGERDAQTLQALETGWGHQDFSILAEVISDGNVSIQDVLEVAHEN